jgi:hypothetical protein
MFNPPLIYHGPDANNLDEKVVDKWPMTEKKRKPKKKKLYLPVKQRASDGDDAAEAEKSPKFQEMHELWWTLSNSTKLDDTATVLCSMPNIDGPHWASLYDRKFCKMDDHTLWDLCDENIRSNCFDIESQQLWGEAAVAADDSSAVSALGLAVSSPILNLQYRLGMRSGLVWSSLHTSNSGFIAKHCCRKVLFKQCTGADKSFYSSHIQSLLRATRAWS